MSRQSRTRVSQLIEQFPALAQIRRHFKHTGGDPKWRNPVTRISVQRPDPEIMYLQGQHMLSEGRVHVEDEHGNRGRREDYLYAVGLVGFADQLMAAIDWGLPEQRDLVFKDIFSGIDTRKVDYVVWARIYAWHKPTTFEQDRISGRLFGERVSRELEIVVYPEPKGKTWQELIEEADRIKKEREEAYLYNPKMMPDLPGIHQALREGSCLHAFLSGGGLRVIRLEKDGKLVGYGEHPNVEEALNHADEDFLAGGRDYREVYGPQGKYPHYLTGSSLPSSNVDAWVRRGHTFDCWQEGVVVIFRLQGYKNYEMPAWVSEQTKTQPGQPIQWKDRGFTFEAVYEEHLLPNGYSGHSMRTIGKPEDKRNDFFYEIAKTGRGVNFWQAMIAAFEAPEEEIVDR